jgi:signal transduction histidine kinase
MSTVIEREFLLQRSASRERSLVTASERRLSRLGFDLHDGALQEIAALSVDVARLDRCGPSALNAEVRSVQRRLGELDGSLRELAHSLEPASLLRRPLEKVVEAEAEALRTRAGVAVDVTVSGDFSTMTPSQRIALIRVLQESCSNIREHSGATRVAIIVSGTRGSVELRVTDDGAGFEVARTLQDAAQRGRLGLVGSSERVRLLGGTFDIRSRPGGPTTVALTLPRWQPLVAERESSLEFAY